MKKKLITPYWEKKPARLSGLVFDRSPHNPLLGEKTKLLVTPRSRLSDS